MPIFGRSRPVISPASAAIITPPIEAAQPPELPQFYTTRTILPKDYEELSSGLGFQPVELVHLNMENYLCGIGGYLPWDTSMDYLLRTADILKTKLWLRPLRDVDVIDQSFMISHQDWECGIEYRPTARSCKINPWLIPQAALARVGQVGLIFPRAKFYLTVGSPQPLPHIFLVAIIESAYTLESYIYKTFMDYWPDEDNPEALVNYRSYYADPPPVQEI